MRHVHEIAQQTLEFSSKAQVFTNQDPAAKFPYYRAEGLSIGELQNSPVAVERFEAPEQTLRADSHMAGWAEFFNTPEK